MKFLQRFDNEGWTVKNRVPFYIRCCDCKLVHKMVVHSSKQRKGSNLGIAAARDNRRTAHSRKEREK